jgi:poly(3-hydroxybutyrate) depolymerase
MRSSSPCQLAGDFRKQRNDELSHWNEWKHWVHGRAVESHDFEDMGHAWGGVGGDEPFASISHTQTKDIVKRNIVLPTPNLMFLRVRSATKFSIW